MRWIFLFALAVVAVPTLVAACPETHYQCGAPGVCCPRE